MPTTGYAQVLNSLQQHSGHVSEVHTCLRRKAVVDQVSTMAQIYIELGCAACKGALSTRIKNNDSSGQGAVFSGLVLLLRPSLQSRVSLASAGC